MVLDHSDSPGKWGISEKEGPGKTAWIAELGPEGV